MATLFIRVAWAENNQVGEQIDSSNPESAEQPAGDLGAVQLATVDEPAAEATQTEAGQLSAAPSKQEPAAGEAGAVSPELTTPDAPLVESAPAPQVEPPYWQSEPLYAALLAEYRQVQATAAETGALINIPLRISGASDGGNGTSESKNNQSGGSGNGSSGNGSTAQAFGGTIGGSNLDLVGYGTDAPVFNNRQGKSLTPLEQFPAVGSVSDCSMMTPLENRDGHIIYRAVFFFAASKYPESAYFAFQTYVVVRDGNASDSSGGDAGDFSDGDASGDKGDDTDDSRGIGEGTITTDQAVSTATPDAITETELAIKLVSANAAQVKVQSSLAIRPLANIEAPGRGNINVGDTFALGCTAIKNWVTDGRGGGYGDFHAELNGQPIDIRMACIEPGDPGPEKRNEPYYTAILCTVTAVDRAANKVSFSARLEPYWSAFQTLYTPNKEVTWIFDGALQIVKSSANPSITSGNACYSLAGAAYGLYRSASDAAADKGRVHRFVTDSAGRSDTLTRLLYGTYYVKELSAPKGYALDGTTYQVAHNTVLTTLYRSDVPLGDPATLLVQKLDTRTGAAYGQDDPSGLTLAGAEFTVRYWDSYFSTVEEAERYGAPTRTWVLRTRNSGFAWFDESNKAAGSDFYISSGLPIIPLGTVAIQETAPPPGYQLPEPNTVTLQQITPTGNPLSPVTRLNTVTVSEAPHEVEVRKVDACTNAAVGNTEFTLFQESAAGVGDWREVIRHTTNGSGYCLFSPLPVGSYKMVETRPNSAYQWPGQAGTVGEQFFAINQASKTVSLQFSDYQLNVVGISKIGDQHDEPISDTEFRIYTYPVEITDGIISTDVSSITADDKGWVAVSEHYAVDQNGAVVSAGEGMAALNDTVITDTDGKALFSRLPYGYYKIDETRSHPLYASLEESGSSAYLFKLEKNSTDQVQVFQNALIQVSVEVYKKTIALTSSAHDATTDGLGSNIGAEEYIYRFGARSTSNVRADEFVVTDDLSFVTTKGYRLTTLWTGTSPEGFDHDGLVALLYKTNLTIDSEIPVFSYHPLSANPPNPNNPANKMNWSVQGGWRIWAEKLSVTEAVRLEIDDLNLAENEYITGLKLVYGGVEKGFFTGRGWQTEADPHTAKNGLLAMATSEPGLLQDWRYAVVATAALVPRDKMGDETVMRGSVKADIGRNWASDDSGSVLTDIDVDQVETRVIQAFSIPTRSFGLTNGAKDKTLGSFALPYTGANVGELALAIGLGILGGTLLSVALIVRRRGRKNE